MTEATFIDHRGNPLVQHRFPPAEAIEIAEAIITASKQQSNPETPRCH